MIVRAEASQLHLLGVLDFLGVTVSPFHGHFGVGVGVDQHVESAIAIQHRKECNGSGNLAEDCLDFFLDFLFGLLDGLRGLGVRIAVWCKAVLLVELGMAMKVLERMNLPWGRILFVSRFSRARALGALAEYLNL